MSEIQPTRSLKPIIIAGVIGTIVFEILALGLSPRILGMPMMPAGLVAALFQVVAGIDIPTSLAWAVHLAAGLILFPLGYVIFREATGLRPWPIAGAMWGVILWFIAQGMLAPLVGQPFMLNFGLFTWASLVAHTLYSLAVAGAFERLKPHRAMGLLSA